MKIRFIFLTMLFLVISIFGYSNTPSKPSKNYSNILKMELQPLEQANSIFSKKEKYVAFKKVKKNQKEEKAIVELAKKNGYGYIKLPIYYGLDIDGNEVGGIKYDEQNAYFFYNKELIAKDIKANQEKIKEYNTGRNREEDKKIQLDMMLELKSIPKEYEFVYSFTSETFVYPFRNLEKAFSRGEDRISIHSADGKDFNEGDMIRTALEFGYGEPDLISSEGTGIIYPLFVWKRIAK